MGKRADQTSQNTSNGEENTNHTLNCASRSITFKTWQLTRRPVPQELLFSRDKTNRSLGGREGRREERGERKQMHNIRKTNHKFF